MLRIGEISTGRCDWRLTAEPLREGDKRAVSLVLSLHLWQGEAPSEASNVIFSVPLDEDILDQQRGTGQENANRKWVGQSAAERPGLLRALDHRFLGDDRSRFH